MADITRPLLNQIKRNIKKSDYFMTITLKGDDYKTNSNLTLMGQLQFLSDVSERLVMEHNRYLALKEDQDDGDEEGTTTEGPNLLVE